MAVVRADEIWEERQASIDERRIRRYTRIWRVITDDSFDGPLAATSAAQIPPLYFPYIEPSGRIDIGSRVRQITPVQESIDPRVWKVRVEYSSEQPEKTGQDPALRTEDPLARPTEIDWDFQRYRKIVTTGDLVDEDDSILEANAAITNSAGIPYDPPPEIDDSRLIVTFARNEALFDVGVARDYQDAVNEDDWSGVLAGQVKLAIKAKSTFESGIQFAKVTYQVEFRSEGWNLQIPDVGYEYLEDGVRKSIILTDGTKPTQPVPLDGNGRKRADDDKIMHYRRYRVYKRRPFSVLSLP
jgi:hypothetical protein